MRLPIGSVLIILSCWLNLQTACAQQTVQTTVPGNFPIGLIPTSPFNDSAAIHAQEERFKAEGAMLDYGVSVATQCKTSLSDFQTKLNQAIAANSYEAASKILVVSEQTVAQAQAIDNYVYRFVNHSTDSPAGRAHNAADANLAAAKQTLAQMQAAYLPIAKRELDAAAKKQAAQDDQIKAYMVAQKAAAEAWDHRITGSLGELSACFAEGTPPSGVNCNVFVGRTLEAAYNTSDFESANGRYLSANEIADFLVASPNWTLIGSGDSQSVLAQAANSAGSRPVVAVWRNPDIKGHGHVVLIGPGPLQFSPKWGLLVPNSAGFSMDEVTARYIGDKLSRGFGNAKKSAVQIYVRLNP